MNSCRHPNFMRRAATLAAIILLLGQAIAAAHNHWNSAQRQFSENSASGIADGSCAICAAHFHSPAAAAVVPVLRAPTTVEFVVAAAQSLHSLRPGSQIASGGRLPHQSNLPTFTHRNIARGMGFKPHREPRSRPRSCAAELEELEK